jgi:hypothetical protein
MLGFPEAIMIRNFSLRAFLPSLYAVGFVLGAAIPGQAAGDELIVGGDMGSLEMWDPPSVPSSAKREIIDENSVFVEVYSSNGKCVKLVDSPKLVHQKYMRQSISPGTGKLVWSFDYKRMEGENDPQDGGFVVRLSSGGKSVIGVAIGNAVTVNAFHGKNSRVMKPPLHMRGVWYHFRAELDLESQRVSARLISELGDTFEFEEVNLVPADGADASRVDEITVGANNGAGPGYSQPILFDNFSLRPAQ